MKDSHDPVDAALKSLGGRQWPGDNYNTQLENRLMQGFDSNSPTARSPRGRLLIAALAVLVMGSAGFAAVGGVEMVKSWFITVKVDGRVVDVQEITPNEDGSATIVVPLPPKAEGEEVTVSIEGTAPADGEDGMKTIHVTLEGQEATIEVEPGNQLAPAGKKRPATEDDDQADGE